MTQKRRKRSKKWIGWLLFLILLVVAVVICYFVWDGYFRDKKKDEPKKEDTPSRVVEKKEEKKSEQKVEEKTTEVLEKEKVVQYDGEDPNEAAEITGAITYAKVSGENLVIRVNIDQYLNSGKCTLGLRRDGGTIYTAEASIVDAATTSTCEGFNVPMTELSGGHTTIWIFLESGDKTGEIHGEVDL